VATTYELTGGLSDAGVPFASNKALAWIERANAVTVINTDTDRLELGRYPLTLDSAGDFAVELPSTAPGAGYDPDGGFVYRLMVSYCDSAPGATKEGYRSEPFSLTADTTLDVALGGTIELTAVSAADWADFQAKYDEIKDVIGTNDGITAANIEDEGSDTYAALAAAFVPVITPEKYGAAATYNGAVDDTAAVMAAAAAVTALRAAVIGGNVFAPGATLRLGRKYNLATLSGPIVVSGNIDGASSALVAPAAYAGVVLLVGHETSANILQAATMTLPSITKVGATSLAAGSVSVKVQNLHDSDIYGRRLDYFETAWLITGLGQGTVYNRIHLGRTDLCKVPHKLAPSTGGWVNSNTFTGGGVTQSPNTLDGSGLRRAGWRHVVIDGSAGVGTVNSNTFVGISYEGDLSEFYFDIKHASNNTWIGATRFEQGTTARSVTLSSDTFTDTAHGLAVGDMVSFLATVSRPGRMRVADPYYVSAVPTADTFKVAETRGGASYTFASNGSGVVYYTPPRIKIDGTGAATYANEIKSGYYSYPGPLDVREINGAHTNPVGGSLPRRDTVMPGRNRLVNGDFRVNQRGYVSAATLAVGVFGFDRWKSNTAATTLPFPGAPQGQLVMLDGYVQQVIERAELPAGTYTLSWVGTAQGKIGGGSYASSGVTGTPAGGTNLNIEFNTGTLSLVQFEPGAIATPFERRPYGTELALCQRYYFKLLSPTVNQDPFGLGQGLSATSGQILTFFPVTMRIAPTALEQTGTAADYRIWGSGGLFTLCSSVPTFNGSTTNSARTVFTTASGNQDRASFFGNASNTTAYLAWSAEL